MIFVLLIVCSCLTNIIFNIVNDLITLFRLCLTMMQYYKLPALSDLRKYKKKNKIISNSIIIIFQMQCW